MSLSIASLNSGSNGNCYYVGNESEAILVDAGISCRETEKRMKHMGLPMERVKAVFISHEHSDHIRGLEILAKKFRLPVYITQPTLINGGLSLHSEQVISFKCSNPVTIGNLTITPFSKHHDASDPYSFTISCHGITVGVFTDLGKCCDKLVHHFKLCHAAFLESNYDVDMLEKGGYPYYLKKRITGGKGHLSNKEALDLFLKHRSAHLQLLLLSHLSANNNSPELVQKLFDEQAKGVKMVVASRHEASGVFLVMANGNIKPHHATQQMRFSFA